MEFDNLGIDPRLQYCTNCGQTWKPNTYHKIVMLVRGEYTRTCPQCQTKMKFRLMHHVVKVETERIKKDYELWERGKLR